MKALFLFVSSLFCHSIDIHDNCSYIFWHFETNSSNSVSEKSFILNVNMVMNNGRQSQAKKCSLLVLITFLLLSGRETNIRSSALFMHRYFKHTKLSKQIRLVDRIYYNKQITLQHQHLTVSKS